MDKFKISKIEKGIPPPAAKSNFGQITEALKEMQVGDSRMIAPIHDRAVIYTSARRLKIKIQTKMSEEPYAYRIWRTG